MLVTVGGWVEYQLRPDEKPPAVEKNCTVRFRPFIPGVVHVILE